MAEISNWRKLEIDSCFFVLAFNFYLWCELAFNENCQSKTFLGVRMPGSGFIFTAVHLADMGEFSDKQTENLYFTGSLSGGHQKMRVCLNCWVGASPSVQGLRTMKGPIAWELQLIISTTGLCTNIRIHISQKKMQI